MAVTIRDVSIVDASTALWSLKSGMISTTSAVMNWRVVRSGTGNAGIYAQMGDVISSASVLLNARAWWVAEGHGVLDGGAIYRRQLCFQVDGTGGLRIKVSARAGFTGTNATASITPSAADERILHGGGSDASPTFAPLFPTTAAWLQGEFSETNDFFYLVAYPVGGGTATALLVCGVIEPLYDSTGHLYDKDPAWYYARTGSTCALATSLASEQNGPMGLLAYGSQSGEAWTRLPADIRCCYDSSGTLQIAIPGGLPQSPAFPTSPVYAQETLRLGRRQALAGTSTGANEGGNLNTCGDKGEDVYIRYSGRVFSVPTILDAVEARGGLTSYASLLGIGNIVLPWSNGGSVRDGA